MAGASSSTKQTCKCRRIFYRAYGIVNCSPSNVWHQNHHPSLNSGGCSQNPAPVLLWVATMCHNRLNLDWSNMSWKDASPLPQPPCHVLVKYLSLIDGGNTTSRNFVLGRGTWPSSGEMSTSYYAWPLPHEPSMTIYENPWESLTISCEIHIKTTIITSMVDVFAIATLPQILDPPRT